MYNVFCKLCPVCFLVVGKVAVVKCVRHSGDIL